jgi:flagellar protein FlaG
MTSEISFSTSPVAPVRPVHAAPDANLKAENKATEIERDKQPENSQREQPVTATELKQAASKVNSFLQMVQRDLHFSVDEDTKALVTKVVDRNSGEVIMQLPAEDSLKLLKQLQDVESKVGFLFKNSV